MEEPWPFVAGIGGPGNPAGQSGIVVAGIAVKCDADLPHVAEGGGPLAVALHIAPVRDHHGGDDADDGDNDQQLEEGEAA